MRTQDEIRELAKEAEKKLSVNNIYTKTFSWVLKKDYENSEFKFLKEDKGVPVSDVERLEFIKKYTQDVFGKRKEIKEPVKVLGLDTTWEFKKWKNLCDARRSADYINEFVLQDLANGKNDLLSKVEF